MDTNNNNRTRWSAVTVALGLIVAMAIPAGAKVERYQTTDYVINVASVNGSAAYAHTFHLTHNPCTDSFTGYGINHYHGATNETLSGITLVGGTLSFRADYDINSYYWEPGFVLNGDGTFTWAGTNAGGVTGATGTWSMTTTSYKNHGQYVAEYGASEAHSCIGMPKASNGHSE